MQLHSHYARVVLAAIVVAASVLALRASRPPRALACSCALQPTPVGGWTREGLLTQGDVVFRGRIVASTEESSDDPSYSVTFQASEVWKGPESGAFTVTAGRGIGDCSVAYQVGQEWLIYGYTDPSGDLDASICSRTQRISGTQARSDLIALGPGTVVAVPTPAPEQALPGADGSAGDGVASWVIATGLIATGALLVLGLAVLSRHRRSARAP